MGPACWPFPIFSNSVAGGRAEGAPGPSMPAGSCCGQRRTGDAARPSVSDPATSPERELPREPNDDGGSRGKGRPQEPHRGERAVEQPAARCRRAPRRTRRSGFSRGTVCDRRLLTPSIRAASAGRASGTNAPGARPRVRAEPVGPPAASVTQHIERWTILGCFFVCRLRCSDREAPVFECRMEP